MNTCNRCGKQVPAGLARCQNCGLPVSSVANNRMGAQEQSELPTWLESLRANERPGVPAGGPQSFSTADLIDDDDLPGWMRAEQAQDRGESDSNKHPAVRPASMSAPNTDAGMMQAGGFSASDLIDPVSLPSWMNPNQQSANPAIAKRANEVPPLFSANDLVDRKSLPTWMSSGQANQSVPPLNQATWQGNPAPAAPLNQATWQGSPAPAAPVPPRSVDNGQQSGLSASSLLDVNALPVWLRDGQQAQGYGNPAGQQGQPVGNNMAAGSLIDMNALPPWLRVADGQPQGPMAERNVAPLSYGMSPRVEVARVPSRPRAEMMPPEQSEVAANVFSSMLGVASNTPYYATPPASGQQGFQGTHAQPSGSLYTAQPVYPLVSPSIYNNEQGAPSDFAGSPTQSPQPSAQGTMPGGYAGSNQYANQNAPNPYAAYSGTNQAQQMPQQPGAFNGGQGVQMSQSSAKPGKRSFFDTIREWFHL